jgi:hypothetical protein
MLRPAARSVDILYPQQEPAARRARKIMRLHRGEGMAQVQPPGRAWREARDDRHRQLRP